MGICYAVSVNTEGSNLKGKARSVFVFVREDLSLREFSRMFTLNNKVYVLIL